MTSAQIAENPIVSVKPVSAKGHKDYQYHGMGVEYIELHQLVRGVDALTQQQALAEGQRRSTLHRIEVLRTDIAVLESALHQALKQAEHLDDQVHDCKALLNANVQTQIDQDEALVLLSREERHLLTETASIRSEVEERCNVISDLKRRLMGMGIEPDRLYELEAEAIVATNDYFESLSLKNHQTSSNSTINSGSSTRHAVAGQFKAPLTCSSGTCGRSFGGGEEASPRDEKVPWYRRSGGMLSMLRKSSERTSEKE